MASTKSTASTTISSGDFVKIDGKGIALVKQQVCRDGAVMYIVRYVDDILTLKLMLNEYKLSPLIAIVKPSRRQAARVGLRLSQIRR